MSPLDGEGLNLNDDEAACLARRLIAHHLRDPEDWLFWEDYPYLGEHAFARLVGVVREMADREFKEADVNDRICNIDSRLLMEQAQE